MSDNYSASIYPSKPWNWSGDISSSNFLRGSYVHGNLDVSGQMVSRTDASFCGNLAVSGAISIGDSVSLNNNIGMSGIINQMSAVPLSGGFVYVPVFTPDVAELVRQVQVLNTSIVSSTSVNYGRNITIGNSVTNTVLAGPRNFITGNIVGEYDTNLNGNVSIGGNVVINRNTNIFGNLTTSYDASFNNLTVGSGKNDVLTNTLVGGGAALQNTTSSSLQNTAIGYGTLTSISSGGSNTAIGYNAGSLTSGTNAISDNMTFLGASTGTSAVGSAFSYSTAIGSGAIVSGSNQIVLGRSTEKTVVSGDASLNGRLVVASDMSMGGNLVIVGNLTVFGGSIVNANIINTTVTNYQLVITDDISLNGRLVASQDATINGLTLGRGAGSAAFNSAFGGSALNANTTGTQNTAIGSNALKTNTTASRNTALGSATLEAFNGTGDSQNTAVGFFSLYALSTGSNNTSVGAASLQNATTGSSNTAVGVGAGGAITTGSRNTALGLDALRYNTTGIQNTGVGVSALQGTSGSSTGSNNTALGYLALYALTTGLNNTAVGVGAGAAITTGNSNVVVGIDALRNTTTASNNVAIGQGALYTNTTGSDNTAVGLNALYTNTTGTQNTAFGFNASLYTTGSANSAFGYQALNGVTGSTGNENSAFGYQALFSITTTGNNNSAFGSVSLRNCTTGSGNTAMGIASLNSNTTGSSNTAVGQSALQSCTTASNNTAVGYGSSLNIINGANSSFGWLALQGAANSNSGSNCAFGSQALTAIAGANYNCAFGNNAGQSVTTGGNNVLIGTLVGAAITTGSNNTAIGYQAYQTGNHNRSTAIGYGAQPTGSNQVVLGTVTETVLCPGTLSIGSSTTNLLPLFINSYGADTYSSAATSGSSRGIYNVPGVAVTGATTINSTNQAFLFDLNCYNSANNATGVYFGGVPTTDGGANSAAQFVVGRRTGASSWSESLRINNSGYVGIGTTSPVCPLHITTGAPIRTQNNTTTFFNNGPSAASIGYNGDITRSSFSIYCAGDVLAASFIANSDERIKTNINDMDNNESLIKIRKLKTKAFNYIDIINHSNQVQYGFIAQEVESVVQQAISKHKDFIPNIYDLADVVGGFTISLKTKSTSLFVPDASGSFFIRLYDISNNVTETKITNIIDDKTFEIADHINHTQIFVYGQQIDDLHTVDKDQIFTVTTAAVQAIDTIVQSQQETINTLQSRLEAIEARLIAAGI